MSTTRVVVASAGDDERARLHARARLLSGDEVVFVGGGQSLDQLVATVVSEDATVLVVDAPDDLLDALRSAFAARDGGPVEVVGCDEPGTPTRDFGE